MRTDSSGALRPPAAAPRRRAKCAGALALLALAAALAAAIAADRCAGTGVLQSVLSGRLLRAHFLSHSTDQGVCMKMDLPRVLLGGVPNATIPLPMGQETQYGLPLSCHTWRGVRLVYTDTFLNVVTEQTVTATYTYEGAISAAYGVTCDEWMEEQYFLSLARNGSDPLARLQTSMDKPWDAGKPPVDPSQVCLGQHETVGSGVFKYSFSNLTRCENSTRPWRITDSDVTAFSFASRSCCDAGNCTRALLDTSFRPHLARAPGHPGPPLSPPSPPPPPPSPPTTLRAISDGVDAALSWALERINPAALACVALGVLALLGGLAWCALRPRPEEKEAEADEQLRQPLVVADQA